MSQQWGASARGRGQQGQGRGNQQQGGGYQQGGRGGWGAGSRGGGGGFQNNSTNQYNALRTTGTERGGGEAVEKTQKEIIAADFESERPKWILSCYCHIKREKWSSSTGGDPCDLIGDVSFEEARFRFCQERAQGRPDYQLVQEFKAAVSAKEKELQALLKAARSGTRLPSQGGPQIRVPNPWVDAFTGNQASQSVIFGAGASKPRFGAGASQSQQMGSQQQQQGLFGGQQTFGFKAPPVFGQQQGAPSVMAAAVSPFGYPAVQPTLQQPLQQQPVFGQQQGAPSVMAAAVSPFGYPAGQPTLQQSQQQQQQSLFGGQSAAGPLIWGKGAGSRPTQGQTSIFGQQQPLASTMLGMVPAALPSPPLGSVSPGYSLSEASIDAFRAQAFEKGKIPDDPPPLELCR